MADQDARALLLTIQANTELLRSNLSAAERAVGEFTRETEAHLDESDERFGLLGRSIEKLSAPIDLVKERFESFIAVFAGERLLETGEHAIELAGSIGETSKALGVGTDFLQKYRFAATQTGSTLATADEGLGKFTKSVGSAAEGNKAIIATFDRLHVGIYDAEGNLRSIESIFADTADGIKRYDDSATAAADTTALFGRGAMSLVPLLQRGAEGFSTLGAAAEQLGVVLSPEMIEHAEQTNQKLSAMKTIVDSAMAKGIVDTASGLVTLAIKIAEAGTAAEKNYPALARLMGIVGAVTNPLGTIAHAVTDMVNGPPPAQALVQADAQWKQARAYRDQVQKGGGDPLALHEADAGVRAAAQRLTAAAQAYREAGHDGPFLGSTAPGASNKPKINPDLSKAQGELADLEKQKVGASGAALSAYNEEILAKQREIAFIKQGATAEMASSLASKQAGAERAGESAAKKAAREAAEAARKAEAARLKSIEEDRVYAGQIASADRAIAEAKLRLVDTSEARYQIEVQRLRDDLAGKDRQVDADVASGKDTPAEGLTLKVKYGSAEQLSEQGAAKDQGDRDAQDALNVQQDTFSRERDHLQAMEDLATTTKQRRDIALQLLDLDEQAQRAQLEYQQAHGQTQADKDRATTALGHLDEQTADRRAVIDRQNEGPLDQYKHQLQGQVGDMGDALQGVGVDGLHGLEDGLVGITTGATTAKQALHNMFLSLLTDLEKLALEKGLLALLGGGSGTASGGSGFLSSLFGGGGSGGGGVLSTLLGQIFAGTVKDSPMMTADLTSSLSESNSAGFAGIASGFTSDIPGFASGGSMLLGGNAGTDKNLLSMNGKPLARVSHGETLAIVPANDTTPARAVIPASVPDMAEIGQARAAVVQSQVNLKIDPSEMFDVRATQNAHDVVDQRKPELVSSSVAATADASRRRVISMSSR